MILIIYLFFEKNNYVNWLPTIKKINRLFKIKIANIGSPKKKKKEIWGYYLLQHLSKLVIYLAALKITQMQKSHVKINCNSNIWCERNSSVEKQILNQTSWKNTINWKIPWADIYKKIIFKLHFVSKADTKTLTSKTNEQMKICCWHSSLF